MHEQYAKYDTKLLKNDFLNRHYECMPFIGERYEDTRLMLIGESHYIPQEAVGYVDRNDYYYISFDDLPDGRYKGWINTRNVFEHRVYDRLDFDNFFSNISTEIARKIYHTDELSKDQKIDAMHQYAFMNYYKRPSYDKGETIRNITGIDNEYAYEISKYIIEVLNPKVIIFLSQKACDAFYESDKTIGFTSNLCIKSVSHPSCPWWNRKRNDGGCGREDFFECLRGIL